MNNSKENGAMEQSTPPTQRTALVTGAARGIGATIARMLAEHGIAVAINYRSKAARAAATAATVTATGQQALLVQADITVSAALQAMAERVAEVFGRLDILVLNASGGLEKDREANYAMSLNRDAQIATLDALLPLLVPGGVVVFVTSHWAHFHGQRPLVAAYESIAASKRAGEDALRARIPELGARGVRLIVVSGDIIEGTITPKLLERGSPGLLAARRAQTGTLPTVEDFAQAIVAAANDPLLPTGHTVFVGTSDDV